MELFDPRERAKCVESTVMNTVGGRRYYRFRYAKFYGGIVTADAVGCCLLCAYCWNYEKNETPETGTFFSPEDVAKKLIKLAEKNRCYKFRISGCEPFLGEASTRHLYKVINIISSRLKDATFVIESNAAVIGSNPALLNEFPKLSVSKIKIRVSLKAENEAQCQKITNAIGAHALQLAGIKAITDAHINCTVATMPNFVKTIDMIPSNVGRETEKMIVYNAKDRLKKRGL